ncbi:GNAT domain-containing protein [Geopyxis carbonaria]|nr:GNAT domain-containing protein [Geopyxis carbonaria]
MAPTPRLHLRPLSPQDLPDFHALWSSPAVTRWTPRQPSASLSVSHDYLASLLSRPRALANHAILEAGRMVGVVGVYAVNAQARERDVGYVLVEEAWGRGYATEALKIFLEAHGRMVEEEEGEGWWWVGKVKAGNGGSVRVLEKCGFVRDEVTAAEEEKGEEGLVVLRRRV